MYVYNMSHLKQEFYLFQKKLKNPFPLKKKELSYVANNISSITYLFKWFKFDEGLWTSSKCSTGTAS